MNKEWLAFGHKFQERMGQLKGSEKEVSPIFLQFLECVHILSETYPREFEFNDLFLIHLFDHLLACETGSFLGNCERERVEHSVFMKTTPVWDLLLGRAEYRNPLFKPTLGLKPLYHRQPRPMGIWTSMYCRW